MSQWCPVPRHHRGQWRQGTASRLNLAACLGVLWLSAPGIAQAGAIQSQAALLEAARAFLETRLPATAGKSVEISLGRLDPRLRLAACDSELKPFLKDGTRLQGKLTVGIRCSGPRPWTIHLPAIIRVYAEVVTTTQPLGRGHTLSAEDLTLVRRDISRLSNGHFTEPHQVVGKILTRNLPAGKLLSPQMLRAELMVRRGDDVNIIVASKGLLIRSKGVALQDGARGDRIPVRNKRSRRVVEGIAVKPGTVQIQL